MRSPTQRLLRTKPGRPRIAPVKPENADAKSGIGIGGLLADEFFPVLITAVATKLSRGSTNFYRSRWNIGMLEWRVLLVLQRTEGLNVRELATAAGLDKSAVSRSLSLLQSRSLVDVVQTRNQGRAAFANLTLSGRKLCGEILVASRSRQEAVFKVFPKTEIDALARGLRRYFQALEAVDWDLSPEQSDE